MANAQTEIKKSKNKNLHPIVIILLIIMAVYALSFLFVLGWGFLTSLKTTAEWKTRPEHLGGPNIWGLPDTDYSSKYFLVGKLTEMYGIEYSIFSNYRFILSSFTFKTNTVSYVSSIFGDVTHTGQMVGFGDFIFNSLIYAVLGAALYTLTCAVSGYLCCKYKFKFSRFLYAMLLVIMTIPLVGTSASTIKMLRSVGLYDTYLSMIVMSMNFTGLYFFVFYAYFHGVSDTYYEAADLDGASQFRILVSIMLPLASKTMLTVFIIQFMALWNNYEATMMYYPSMPTLANAVQQMANNTTNTTFTGPDFQDVPQKIAGCMILAIPSLTLFLCLKNVIMGNLTMGGIKE